MWITRLLTEDFTVSDPSSRDREIADPRWEQIERAIRRLDGNNRSTVILGRVNPAVGFMVIAGGESDVYVVNASDSAGREFALIDRQKPVDSIVEVLMGQITTRTFNEIVDLKTALLAARSYAELGLLDNRLDWKDC